MYCTKFLDRLFSTTPPYQGSPSGHSPVEELGEGATISEARTAHPDVLLESQVLDLVLDPQFLPVTRLLGLIGFDAPASNHHSINNNNNIWRSYFYFN